MVALQPRRATVLPALLDLAALALFVTIGLLSHRRGLSAGGYARDLLPLTAGWFGAALVLHPYRDARPRRLLATWAIGVPAGVLVRALVLGHGLNGGEAAFLGVCLVAIGLLVALGRLALVLAARLRPGRGGGRVAAGLVATAGEPQ